MPVSGAIEAMMFAVSPSLRTSARAVSPMMMYFL
jgi:hypothetical protein